MTYSAIRSLHMDDALLLLSTTTGYQLRSFDEAADRAGVGLVLATDRCHQLDDPWQDRAVAVRFHAEEASLRAVRDGVAGRRVRGVLAVGDRPVILAARAAGMLGVPGNRPEAAAASRSKRLTRERFADAGLPSPWHVALTIDQAAAAARDARIRYPCVVKPTGLSGSRGVIRADSPPGLEQAIARVRRLLQRPDVRALRTGLEDEILVERFIAGRELAIEGVLTDGRLQVFAIFDKPDPLDGPFFEETIYVTPPELSPGAERDVTGAVEAGIRALGLRHGAIHAECRLNPSGVYLLEVAARPIGGLCAKVLMFREPATGAPLTLEDVLVRHALREDITSIAREPEAAGVMMIPIPRRGVLKGVAGEAEALAVPGVHDVRITAKRDQLLETLPEAGSYLGFIFARGATPPDVVAALRTAHARLTFDIRKEVVVAGSIR